MRLGGEGGKDGDRTICNTHTSEPRAGYIARNYTATMPWRILLSSVSVSRHVSSCLVGGFYRRGYECDAAKCGLRLHVGSA